MTVEEGRSSARNFLCKLYERRAKQLKAATVRSKQPCTFASEGATTTAIAL
jgi:hypothetical protein